jgi:hypothetical protein
MHTAQQIERAPRVQVQPDYNEDDEFCRSERLAAMWQLTPRYVVTVGRGDCVILDGCGRPIACVFCDERVEILEPDAEYHPTGEITPFHDSSRDYVRCCIETYKLAPEIRRRWSLQQRGELAGGWGW